MKYFRITYLYLLAIALVIMTADKANSIIIVDPLLPDTLIIESISSGQSGIAVVPINFYNDEPLGGVEAAFVWNSPDLVLDSFSFVGGRVEYTSLKGSTIDTLGNTVIIYSAPFNQPEIPVGTGLLGKLFFSYSPVIIPTTIDLDTISIIDGNKFFGNAFIDLYNNRFVPQSISGQISLVESCCIGMRGNFNDSPDQSIDISDLTAMINYLFKGGPYTNCPTEGDMDGSFDDFTDISDLTYFISYLFKGGPPPPDCFP